jgi:hypothetical protein
MTKKAFSLAHCSASYAVYGGVSFDLKNGIAENGVTIELAEDLGERVVGADGSSMWTEYMTSHGTITVELMPYSDAYPFFITLQNAQRATGSKGQDTITIIDRDLQRNWVGSDVAIQSISGEQISKSGNNVVTVTLSCGSITRQAA